MSIHLFLLVYLLGFNLLYSLYVDYGFVVLLVDCVAENRRSAYLVVMDILPLEHHRLGVVAALAYGSQIVHWLVVLLLVMDE